MSSTILQATPDRARSTFVPLFYSFAGWGLAHAWLVLINASSRAHFLTAVPALALVALSTLRASAALRGTEMERPASDWRWGATRGALLLFLVGAVFGLLVVNGSVLLLAIAALSFPFVPSTRLPFRKHHVGLPVLVTGVGFVTVVLPGYRNIDLMFLPVATWAFWLCACSMLLLRIEQSRRAERGGKAGDISVGAEVRPADCDG